MKLSLGLKHKKAYSIFLSNTYFSLTLLKKDSCELITKHEKSQDSYTIIDDIRSNASLFKNIEPGDAHIILDVGLSIVKTRFLPKAIKQKDIENALKLSLETDIGHKLNNACLIYDILLKTDDGNIYLVAYAEKEDVILAEKSFKKYGLNVKSVSHFVVYFINALIELNVNIPINAVYINKDYYFLLKLGERFIDYKKVDITNFNEQKESILKDIDSSALFLGLEDVKLVYSSLFAEDHDFYDRLRNLLHVRGEIFPPYDFDCYLLQVNRSIY